MVPKLQPSIFTSKEKAWLYNNLAYLAQIDSCRGLELYSLSNLSALNGVEHNVTSENAEQTPP